MRTLFTALLAVMLAVVGMAANAMHRESLATPTSLLVSSAAAPGDTLGLVVHWTAAADANGAPSEYRILAYRLAAPHDTVHARTVSVTRDTLFLPRPAPGQPLALFRIEVRAVRRQLVSAPAGITIPVTPKPDTAPTPPSELRVDTLPGGTPVTSVARAELVDWTIDTPPRDVLLTVGDVSPVECAAAGERLLTAGVYLGTRGDTAMFVRPFSTVLPSFSYCVAPKLAVRTEGELVQAGAPASDSIPSQLYPAYGALPFEPGTFQPQGLALAAPGPRA